MTRKISASRSAAIVQCCMDLDPEVRKGGFRKAVRAILPEAQADFIPDAYAIRPAERAIELIEVVDTNPIMKEKASKIAELWEQADDAGWSVSVVGYDSCGGLMFHIPGVAFYPAYTRKFMQGEGGNYIPAALAVYRELSHTTP